MFMQKNKFKNYSDVNQEDITNILVDSDFKLIRKKFRSIKKKSTKALPKNRAKIVEKSRKYIRIKKLKTN